MAEKLGLKGIWDLLKKSGKGFIDDNVAKMSASLAFYTIFSLGPMLIVILYMANLIWGGAAAEGTVFNQVRAFIGDDAALQVQEVIQNADISGKGPITATIGIITLLIGATTVFAEIQDSINTIWKLKIKSSSPWWKAILNRLVSFSIIVSLGFLLLVSLLLNGLIEALMGRLQQMFPDITVILLYIINLIITFAITTALFAIIFKVLPDAVIKWKDVMVGAMVTTGLFMAGKFGITYYIRSSDLGTTYGAAGSLVLLLLWVYYSAFILYFGAEFTKAYASRHGDHIHPNKYAAWIKNIEVEEEHPVSLKDHEEKKAKEEEDTGDHIKVT
ncbi:MAG TPA: YihY/virulence factor BrkB family protein [Flavisolibacter sp.]|nr:YihY/virulence factor BrkB family protein [Flavisolibacter sp.]